MDDHHLITPAFWFGFALLYLGARLGGVAALRLKQPAVLGEVLAGVLLGNLGLVGITALEPLKHDAGLVVLAEIGAILLLFEAGLESSLSDLLAVGASAATVAVIGVALPFALGAGVSSLFAPGAPAAVHAFVGAALTATSVGITARALKDLGQLRSPEARIILGAAVLDDVLGLIILAIVQGLVLAAGAQSKAFAWTDAAWIAAKAIIFLAGALFIGKRMAPMLFRYAAKLRGEGLLLAASLGLCLVFAGLAALSGLAPIVGAFAAGAVIDGTGFARFFGESEPSVEHLIFPVSSVFVPVFFAHMGLGCDLRAAFRPETLALAAALTAVAIIGKLAAGWGAGNRVRRLVVGIGMMPRGEVGLIFAAIGASLTLNGQRVVDAHTYGALVAVVLVTTAIAPAWLRRLLGKQKSN